MRRLSRYSAGKERESRSLFIMVKQFRTDHPSLLLCRGPAVLLFSVFSGFIRFNESFAWFHSRTGRLSLINVLRCRVSPWRTFPHFMHTRDLTNE